LKVVILSSGFIVSAADTVASVARTGRSLPPWLHYEAE
jgi:murein DD-endopeptidase MepM/ murein hydrolase activator NlpD